jgi:hypothetical protein
MPLSSPIVIRRFVEGCYSFDIRRPLTTLCLFLLLSFFTSIVINILIPFLFFKTSPSIISSSSLSLLSSSHIFFPSDSTSLQCTPKKNQELQTHDQHQDLLNTQRKYTKDQSKQKNVSSGKLNFDLFSIKPIRI